MRKRYLPLFFLPLLIIYGCQSSPVAQEKEQTTQSVLEANIQNIRTIEELPPWVFDSTPVNGTPPCSNFYR
jgi:hypothetical protein